MGRCTSWLRATTGLCGSFWSRVAIVPEPAMYNPHQESGPTWKRGDAMKVACSEVCAWRARLWSWIACVALAAVAVQTGAAQTGVQTGPDSLERKTSSLRVTFDARQP